MTKSNLLFIVASLWIIVSYSYAELGTQSNTLFLWHFDNSESQADYAQALDGPVNAIQAYRPLVSNIMKFGARSYPQDHDVNGGTIFSIYTNGQWLINPHECTIDYWMYYTSDWPDPVIYGSYGIGPGFYASSPSRYLLIGTASSKYGFPDGLLVKLSNGTQSFQMNVPYSIFTSIAQIGQWNHFAWTWSSLGNKSYVYLNGIAVASTYSNVSSTTYGIQDALWQSVKSWYIQGFEGNLTAYSLPGPTGIDELRISNIDRYGGANFTPPSYPYPPTTTLNVEIGTQVNTLFLWHFDGSQSQADYAKAASGPMNTIVGDRPLVTDTEKFGSGCYPEDPTSLGTSSTLFSMYTNGQWLINPYEGTIDYWIYYPDDWPNDNYGLGPGLSNYPNERIWIRTNNISQGTGLEVRLDGDRSHSFSLDVPYSTVTTIAPIGQWNHFAWTWSSLYNKSFVFLNGIAVASTYSGVSSAAYASSNWQNLTWYVQGYEGNLFGYGLPGARMDELRISDIDRYNGSNFTLPISPYSTPTQPSTIAEELGTMDNTLFLWHFDGSQTQADYAKAVNGPINAITAQRPLTTVKAKFGNSSYPQDASSPGTSSTLFSIYTNGQWLLNPHECTIDYWLYVQNDWTIDYWGIGPGIWGGTPTRRMWIATDRPSNGFPDGLQVRLSNGYNTFGHNIPYSTVTAYAPVGQWNHIAWTWSSISDQSYIYLNGFALNSTFGNVSSVTYGIPDSEWQALFWYVQGYESHTYGYGLPGAYMDELRISDIDRYGGANFTPPTTPYPLPVVIEDWMLYGGRNQFN